MSKTRDICNDCKEERRDLDYCLKCDALICDDCKKAHNAFENMTNDLLGLLKK